VALRDRSPGDERVPQRQGHGDDVDEVESSLQPAGDHDDRGCGTTLLPR
jgi:hypothetical protein